MRNLLLFSLLLAFSAAAIAQTSQAALATQPQASESPVSSNGPVVLDYSSRATSGDPVEVKVADAVRHQVLKLPYYSMFDDLEYSVQGRTVTLNGYVTSIHSETRQDAERAVKHIEGVDNVVNNIKVLSPNPLDQEARERVLRSLMRTAGLSRYFWEASPSIHIIVDNQRVTLKGYVSNEGDKNLANIAANEVRDVFQVTNNLQVVK
ncbi:MAG: BON domain-containing protein [Candidatus Korobacteraceae bacterium]